MQSLRRNRLCLGGRENAIVLNGQSGQFPGLQLVLPAAVDTAATTSPSPSFLLIFRQILNPFGVKALCKAKCYPNS